MKIYDDWIVSGKVWSMKSWNPNSLLFHWYKMNASNKKPTIEYESMILHSMTQCHLHTIMGSQYFREVCKILRWHKEALSNNDLSIRSLLSIINNMERQNHKQYDKIMGILEKIGGKIYGCIYLMLLLFYMFKKLEKMNTLKYFLILSIFSNKLLSGLSMIYSTTQCLQHWL